MPPKRKRVGDPDLWSPEKKQAIDSQRNASVDVAMQLPELIEAIIDLLKWKDLPAASLVCSKWFNIVKKQGRDYEYRYRKEYGGHSAFSYDTILEDPDRDEDEFAQLTWKEKYDTCTAEVNKMRATERRRLRDDDDPKQKMTVWALENGHAAFLKKLIEEGHYSNLEYYERNIVEIIQERKDYKTLKVIMTDLPQDQRDELDLFTILTQAVSNNDLRTAKKMFKYGFKCDAEVGRCCVVSAVLSKNYDIMKLLADNNAAYYPRDLEDAIEEHCWENMNWIKYD